MKPGVYFSTISYDITIIYLDGSADMHLIDKWIKLDPIFTRELVRNGINLDETDEYGNIKMTAEQLDNLVYYAKG